MVGGLWSLGVGGLARSWKLPNNLRRGSHECGFMSVTHWRSWEKEADVWQIGASLERTKSPSFYQLSNLFQCGRLNQHTNSLIPPY